MHMRNSAGVLKTVSAIHMRNAANALKTVPAIHMRNSANALKTAYSSGGGGAGNSVSVSPPSYNSSSATSHSNASDFTATPHGAAASTYNWTVTPVTGNCSGAILSGQGTNTCRVQITTTDGGLGRVSVRCTITFVDTTVNNDTATKSHQYTGP